MNRDEIEIGGHRVRTFQIPPEGFDATKATDRELLVYGFPKRPDPATQSELHEQWVKFYSRPWKCLQPVFRQLDGVVHGPRRLDAEDSNHANTNRIWSGSVVPSPPGDSFKWAGGVWTIPSPQVPAGKCDGNWYYSAAWVGIDGDLGSTDVLQAGSEHDAICVNGHTQQSLYVWWEWYPGPTVVIDNLPFAIGDSVSCVICAVSSTEGQIYFNNLTRNIQISFFVTAGSGVSLTGNTAEWIVERPSADNGVADQLADYGQVEFTGAISFTNNQTVLGADAGSIVSMRDDYCNITSFAFSNSTQEVQCTYTNPGSAPFLAAWKGIDGDQGIYFALFDGCFFLPQQKLRGVGTSVGPAVALWNGTFFMVWKGVSGDQGIYFSSSSDGNTWAGQQNFRGVGTSFRPALAVFNDRLFMAWKGIDGDQGVYFSSFDGESWAPQKHISGIGSSGGIALAVFQGRLFMAWAGVAGDQGIYFSSFDGANWAPQQNVRGIGTSQGPSLAVFKGKLFMAWKGIHQETGIYFSSFDGSNWAGQQRIAGIGTSVGPQLSVLGCKLFMSWRGIQPDQGIWYTNFNGEIWYPQQNVIHVGSSVGPCLAS